jgi:gamma-glutamyltranspeptidase
MSTTQQLLCHLLEGCLDPQTAIDRPRFCILGGDASGDVAVEDAMPDEVVTRLREMGHTVRSLLLLLLMALHMYMLRLPACVIYDLAQVCTQFELSQ